MKKLSFIALLCVSIVFVVGSTCLIGSDSKKATETVTLAIDGMTCEALCANKIETALTNQKGVKNADVCFDSKTAKVEFIPGKINAVQIKNTIIDAGYLAKDKSSCDYDSKKASVKVGSSCESSKASKESI